jgi:hypothetical protein
MRAFPYKRREFVLPSWFNQQSAFCGPVFAIQKVCQGYFHSVRDVSIPKSDRDSGLGWVSVTHKPVACADWDGAVAPFSPTPGCVNRLLKAVV